MLILDEFHLLRPEGAARLLKTVEEPPPSTVFVILADDVPIDLVTIASRCVRVDFHALPDHSSPRRSSSEGVTHDTALASARAAAGNLDRARLLADDPAVATRTDAFAGLPRRLDGTGARRLPGGRRAARRSSTPPPTPLKERQAREAGRPGSTRWTQLGERGSGQRRLEERHKRELRRHRIDELKAGLAASAATYRDALVEGRRAPPGRRGRRRAGHPRRPSRPWSATRTSTCSSRPSCSASRRCSRTRSGSRRPRWPGGATERRPATVARPLAQIAQSVEQRTRNA